MIRVSRLELKLILASSNSSTLFKFSAADWPPKALAAAWVGVVGTAGAALAEEDVSQLIKSSASLISSY